MTKMYLKENFYTRDALRKLKDLKKNKNVNYIVGTSESIDPIQDYPIFKKFVIKDVKYYHDKMVEQTRKRFGIDRSEFGSEGLFYGHRKAFFDYAGVNNNKSRFLFPCFEHGVDFRIRDKLLLRDPKRYENHSFVTISHYKNAMLHAALPYSPVYNIGPYLLYAEPYYTSEKLKELKEKFGKTALLFPGHSYEGSTVTLDEDKFVDDVMNRFKNDYDTILISVYWNDVDKPIYDKFEAAGAKLVSSGFRGDQNFSRRQRAIIELADVVASNMEGTYIGYAIALKKPFFMFNTRARLHDTDWIGTEEEEREYEKTIDGMFNAFTPNPEATNTDIINGSAFTEEQKQMQHDFYTRFYGTPELFRTKEQARTIISLSEKLVKAGGATVKGIERVVKEIVEAKDTEKVATDIAGINGAEMEEFRKAMSW